MIQAAQSADVAPAPPTLPPVPQRATAAAPGAVPLTGDEVQAIRIRLNDLRRELQDAAERRNSIANRLHGADPDARPGYQARLQVLDNRIIGIETEITTLAMQLRNAPASALVASAPQDVDPNLVVSRVASEIVPIIAILSVFVLGPIAIAMARLIWKRAANPPPRSAALDQATQQKLEHLQQAVDTIAIEVERISEGQRFVTRLMSERAIGPGAAEPVRAQARTAMPSERG